MEDPAQNTNIQPTPVISSVRREIETAVSSNYDIQRSGAEKEPNITPELKEAGLETTPLVPNLTKEHFDVGISHSPEAVSPNLEPKGAVSLPMTKIEAVNAEKGKDDESKTWYGTLLAKIYRRLGILSLRETKS